MNLDQLSSVGWGGLEFDDNQFSADMQKLMEEAVLEAQPIGQLFSTPEGEKVLQWLVQKTIMRPPLPEEVAAKTLEEYALLKARRDGQNGVVFMILHAIQVAKGEASEGEVKP